MFCEMCGTKLLDSAEFCVNCGTPVAGIHLDESIEKMLDTNMQLRVRPNFKFSYVEFPLIIVFSILIAILMLVVIFAGSGIEILLGTALVMAIILKMKATIDRKQYDNCCYDFYKTKVIYNDRFFRLIEKEVKYKYIKEITMQQTFIQRFFDVGNIILFTNAESGLNNGIYIINVENVQDVYRKIKSIIDV